MKSSNVEAELLKYCLQSCINSTICDPDSIRTISGNSINWSNFLKLVFSNRISYAVWHSMKSINREMIPEKVMHLLSKASFQQIAYNNYSLKELDKLFLVFQDNEVPVILFKGPALAQYYPDKTFRESGDFDVIIHKKQLHKVAQLLFHQGYALASEKEAIILKKPGEYHSCEFLKKDGKIGIDVHWSISDACENVWFPLETVWTKTVSKVLLKVPILFLDPESEILSICIHHGLVNCWKELRYICDLAMIISHTKELDWRRLIVKADKAGVKKSLLVGIALANDLIGIPSHLCLHSAMYDKRDIKRIKDSISHQLLLSNYESKSITWAKTKSIFAHNWIKIAMRDSLYKSLFFAITYIKFCIINYAVPAIKYYINFISPNAHDRQVIKLPSALHFMYYFVKFYRILHKWRTQFQTNHRHNE